MKTNERVLLLTVNESIELIKIVKNERDRIIRLLEEGNVAGQKIALFSKDFAYLEQISYD